MAGMGRKAMRYAQQKDTTKPCMDVGEHLDSGARLHHHPAGTGRNARAKMNNATKVTPTHGVVSA